MCGTNVNVHLGDIVRKAQWNWYTKEEVEAEKARTKVKSIATKEEAAAKHCAVMLTIAGLKASIKCKEEAIQVHVNHPDLCYCFLNMTQRALTQESQVPVRAQKYTSNIVYGSAG